MLQACDVGHRVVIRRRIGAGEHGRDLLTDLLGELRAIDDHHATVRRDDGVEHVVPLTEVTAAKRIPPRPARYSQIASLERTADEAWPAAEREQLGEWLLRAAGGFTNRANSALPLGDPGRALDPAIDACVQWYQARSLTPRITVPLPLRRDVADALIRRGWVAQPVVLVQTAQLAEVLAGPALEAAASARLSTRPSAGFLRIITTRKTVLPEIAHRVLNGGGEVRFAELPHDERPDDELFDDAGTAAIPRHPDGAGPWAIARGALVGEWMHLGLVEVIEAARGRGLARALTQALASWAVTLGARRAVLQVEQDNAAAVSLYRSMGFSTHHTYVTYRYPV